MVEITQERSQPDHILANPIMSQKAERRPGPGETGLAVTKHGPRLLHSNWTGEHAFDMVEIVWAVGKADVFHLQAALGLPPKVEDRQRHDVFRAETFIAPEYDTHWALIVTNVGSRVPDQAEIP